MSAVISTTDGRISTQDRRKRSSLLPTPAMHSAGTAAPRKPAPKKLSKNTPPARSLAADPLANHPALRQPQVRHLGSFSGPSLVPPSAIRTPSLISGSSASTFDSPKLNILRRKPSTIAKFVAERSEASTVHYDAKTDDSVFGISMPTILTSPSSMYLEPSIPTQAERIHWNSSQPLSLSSLGITSTDSPSTRFTEPPFSHLEAPSSQSSVSPSNFSASRAYQPLDGSHLISPPRRAKVPAHKDGGSSTPVAATSQLPRHSNQQLAQTSRLLSATRPSQLLASPELMSQTTVQPVSRPAPQAPQASSSKQAPPELAHLSGATRTKTSHISPTQMSRFQQSQLPQRNSSLLDGPLVVAPSPAQHHRTGSRGSVSSTTSLRDRLGLTSKSLSKLSLATSDRSSRIPDKPAHSQDATQTKMRIAQNASDILDQPKKTAHKSSRFGFLKKTKTEPVVPADKPKREPRKGPAAGTGHERYGKFGIRGRSGSTTSTTDSRSPSTSSQKSGFSDRFRRRKDSSGTQGSAEMSEFLKERLQPRVIRGSGSNFSAITSPSVVSMSDREGSIFEGLTRVSTSQSQNNDNVSVTSSAVNLPGISSPLADSIAYSQREPTPHPTRELDPALVTKATSTTNLRPQDVEEGFWLQPMDPIKKQTSRWNFLQRVRSSPLKTKKPGMPREGSPEQRRSPFDNAAHFALLDAVEPVTLEEVEQLVASPTQFASPRTESVYSQSSIAAPVVAESRPESLLPSPPSLGALIARELSPVACAISPIPGDDGTSSIVERGFGNTSSHAVHAAVEGTAISAPVENTASSTLRTPDLSSKDSPRIPRLSPVGRIPRVKSGRDRDRQLPTASFSRPFVNTQSRPTVKPPGTLYTQIRETASPTIEDGQDSIAVALSPEEVSQKIIDAFPRPNNGRESRVSTSYPGFSMFSFPSRKNSNFSYSSSSDTASYMAFAYNRPFDQEDVWHEYNDLIDQVSPDHSFRPSRQSSTNCSAQSAIVNNSLQHFKDRAILVMKSPASPPPEQALPQIPRNQSSKTVSSIAASLSSQNGRHADKATTSPQKSQKDGSVGVGSSRDSQISSRSRSMSFPEGNVRSSHTSFSSGADLARRSRISTISIEDDRKNGVHPSVNVNFDALMTSKWLSFGRVLFSPAHNEMRFSDDPRILILDGLSDEWSYFVAQYYTEATVYNLDLTNRSGPRQPNQQMPNHRRIHHAAVGAPLPFPKGFFTAAILRFPVATTDQAYHTAIAEFKRVLRPGGHLEISMLDIDLRCMGPLARKAIRGLKTRMQQQQEDVSLRSLSDFMLQVVGKRGFEEIQRCVVGVPVISRALKNGETRPLSMIGGAATTSLSAIKDRNSMSPTSAAAGIAQVTSLTSPTQETDDKMARMVARVGRWWYSMSYERAVPRSDQSIWKDDALLQECFDNGTSFQLLMCHAQKPVHIRRHTRSV